MSKREESEEDKKTPAAVEVQVEDKGPTKETQEERNSVKRNLTSLRSFSASTPGKGRVSAAGKLKRVAGRNQHGGQGAFCIPRVGSLKWFNRKVYYYFLWSKPYLDPCHAVLVEFAYTVCEHPRWLDFFAVCVEFVVPLYALFLVAFKDFAEAIGKKASPMLEKLPMAFNSVGLISAVWCCGRFQVGYLFTISWSFILLTKVALGVASCGLTGRKQIATDDETVNWLNMALQKAWEDFLEDWLSGLIKNSLNNLFNNIKPRFLESLGFVHFCMGKYALQIESAKTIANSEENGDSILELKVKFCAVPSQDRDRDRREGYSQDRGRGEEGEEEKKEIAEEGEEEKKEKEKKKKEEQEKEKVFQIVLQAVFAGRYTGFPVKLYATKLHIEGTLRLGLKWQETSPFLDKLDISFLEPPTLDFQLKPMSNHAVSITDLPGISPWLDGLLKEIIARQLVEPNKINVLLGDSWQKAYGGMGEDPNTFTEKLMPSGTMKKPIIGRLTLTIESADGLVAADSIGASDPYVTVSVGDKPHKSGVVWQTCAPRWGFMIPQTNVSSWVLTFQIYDYDFGQAHDYLGECMLRLDQYPFDILNEVTMDVRGGNGTMTVSFILEDVDEANRPMPSDFPFEELLFDTISEDK
eukprot:gene11795-13926_t